MDSYAGTATRHAAIRQIEDGDDRDGANLAAGAEDNHDNFLWLCERVPGAGETPQVRVIPVEQLWGVEAYWALDTSEVTRAMKQLQVGHSYHCQVEITPLLPYFGQISGIYARLRGAPLHSALPGAGDLPEISLCSRSILAPSTTALTVIDTAADASATLEVFEGVHQIGKTLADAAAPLGGSMRYWLRLVGEAGANALEGLKIDCLFVEVKA